MTERKRLPNAVARVAKNGPPSTPLPATIAFAIIFATYLIWEIVSSAPEGLVSVLGVAAGAWFGAYCTYTYRKSNGHKNGYRKRSDRDDEELLP